MNRIISIAILTIYYYIILSITSGYDPAESNTLAYTFILFYLTDIILISTLSAVFQYKMADVILKNKKVTGFLRLFF